MRIKNEDVVERLVTLGYNLNEGDVVTLQFAINGTEQYIKDFCNIADIPQELYSVAVDMAAGTLLKTKRAIGINVCENIDFENDSITSIKEGDVSITYNNDNRNSATAKYNTLLDRLCNRDDELIAFRKVRW